MEIYTNNIKTVVSIQSPEMVRLFFFFFKSVQLSCCPSLITSAPDKCWDVSQTVQEQRMREEDGNPTLFCHGLEHVKALFTSDSNTSIRLPLSCIYIKVHLAKHISHHFCKLRYNYQQMAFMCLHRSQSLVSIILMISFHSLIHCEDN